MTQRHLAPDQADFILRVLTTDLNTSILFFVKSHTNITLDLISENAQTKK